jgi:hypothetical protein
MDSTRSPRVAAATAATPSTRPSQTVPGNRNLIPSAPAARHRTADPASPSHVFFGLMLGAIAWRPNRMPAK